MARVLRRPVARAAADSASWAPGPADLRDSLAVQRLSSRMAESIIRRLMMHTIAEAQSSSSQT